MKLSARAGDFASALALADTVLAAADPTIRKNATLSATRVTATDNTVSFALDILDRAIVVKTTAGVIEPGEAAVSLKALSALMIGCEPDSTINISTTDKAMMIGAGRGRFRLPVVPIADMPVMPAVEPENEIEIEAAAFMSLLRVMSAASNEQTRYYLHGILLHTVDRHLVAVGTDGHRLMRAAVPAAFFSRGYGCIVPLPTATVIGKLVKRTKPGTIKIKRARTLLAFETPDVVFISKLVDATYPDYTRIIPETAKNTVTVDNNELVAALNRLSAVAAKEKDKVPLAALSWREGGNLELFLARQPDDGNDIVVAETTGNGQVAAKLSLLTELLEEIAGDCISLSTSGPGAPIVIRLVGDERLVALLMPCVHNFTIRETGNENDGADVI